MEERERFYVDPVNRNIDIILGLVGLALAIAFFYIFYLYNQNEMTKEYFNITDIENVNWVNDTNDVSFKIIDSKLSLTIDGTEIIDKADYEFNSRTGEFKYKKDGKWVSENLYLRSATTQAITIWYNYAELHLEKEIEVK